MIVLSGGGPNFGLPETSPYVTKTEVQLRMAGLAYEKRKAQPSQGPKGQIPFIEDDGRVIGDSAFIRMHLEAEYDIDFDAGLSALERAQALAIELMVDHELSPAVFYFRWLAPENFAKGPARFFDAMPAEIRETFKADIVKRVRENMTARGIARHSVPEITALAVRSLKALELMLGDKPYLMGDEPCGADAFVFAVLAAAMTPFFDSPIRPHALAMPTLVAYVVRMMDRFYPEFEWDAGKGDLKRAA
jgi:glutathione S-transferase